MDFTLSENQQLLRDTAHTLLAKECPASLLRAHLSDPSAADVLWVHLRDFTALGCEPLTDRCLFMEELGYVAAPGPFFATTAQFVPLLAALEHPLLAEATSGSLTGTVALAGVSGEWVLNDDPVKTFVAEADRVDWIAIVSARRDGSPGADVRLAARDDVVTDKVATIDWSRRLFEVDSAGLTAAVHTLDADRFRTWCDAATVALASEQVGTARRCLDMALAYAKERMQFGVPIGSFQAIQHKLADVALLVERAQAAVQYAAMTIDAGDPERHRATHVAKAAASTAATRAAKESVQVHGGIGYTWEHDLHLFVRRAYGSAHWMGTVAWHHDRLAELLLAG